MGTFKHTGARGSFHRQKRKKNDNDHTRNFEAIIFDRIINEWPQSKAEQTITGRYPCRDIFVCNIAVASMPA